MLSTQITRKEWKWQLVKLEYSWKDRDVIRMVDDDEKVCFGSIWLINCFCEADLFLGPLPSCL